MALFTLTGTAYAMDAGTGFFVASLPGLGNCRDRDFPCRRGKVELVFSRGERTRQVIGSVTHRRMRTDPKTNAIIRLAWEDRTTFEEIEEKTGLTEKEVIKVMRRELKPSSFRLWRKRVNGRITKHRKRFEKEILRKGEDDF